MSTFLLAALCVVLAFIFPLLSLYFIRKTRQSGERNEGLAELKASVLFLQTALPSLVFLLGALGITSYQDIVNKVTQKVEAKADTLLHTEQILTWTNEIKTYHEKARQDSKSITSIATTAKDAVTGIAVESFLNLLPRGTIIPYSGERKDIDTRYWTICDGTKGTPDLRDRFIFGSTFKERGATGGARTHTHQATLTLNGEVMKTNQVPISIRDGQGTRFNLDRHEHGFKIVRQNVTL